jgi:hypothetical protein
MLNIYCSTISWIPLRSRDLTGAKSFSRVNFPPLHCFMLRLNAASWRYWTRWCLSSGDQSTVRYQDSPFGTGDKEKGTGKGVSMSGSIFACQFSLKLHSGEWTKHPLDAAVSKTVFHPTTNEQKATSKETACIWNMKWWKNASENSDKGYWGSEVHAPDMQTIQPRQDPDVLSVTACGSGLRTEQFRSEMGLREIGRHTMRCFGVSLCCSRALCSQLG